MQGEGREFFASLFRNSIAKVLDGEKWKLWELPHYEMFSMANWSCLSRIDSPHASAMYNGKS